MPPSVYSNAPCCAPRTAAASVTVLSCLVTEFFPGDVKIQWVMEGGAKPSTTFTGVTNVWNPTWKSYTASNHVTVPDGVRAPRCKVDHPASNSTFFKTFVSACASVTQPPWVYVVEPRCEAEGGETEAELLCVFQNSGSERLEVSWLRNGQEVSRPVTDGGRSRLKINRETWDLGDVYTCKVTRSAGGGAVLRNASKCTACSSASAPPQLYATQPSYADLLAGRAVASCLLLGRHLEGASLAWHGERPGTPPSITRHPNGSQSLVLTRAVTLAQWVVGQELRCRADLPCHRYLTQELRLGPTPSTPASSRKPPKVKVTHVPAGDARAGGLLLCDVTGFTPRDIDIRWAGAWDLQDRTETGPINGREVFSVLSILRLEEGEEGKDYACVVQHPTLEQPLRITEDAGPPKVSPTPKMQEKPSSRHDCPRSPPSSLQPPSFHELFLHRAANLTCTTLLANATMSWAVGGRPADPEAVKTHPDGATGTRSWLRVSLRDWNDTANFSCRVRGDTEETQLEIRRRTGPLKPPSVHVVPSSPAEACAGRDFTLFCLVKDFYPPEIAVWWRRGANEGPADEALSCDHEAQRCSLVIALDVPWGEWAAGASYSCSAAHISTEEVAEKSVDAHADPWDCAGLHIVPCGLLGEGDDLEPEEDGSAWTTTSTFVALFLLLIFYSGFVTFIKVK